MRKLGIISRMSIDDRTNWSGTVAYLKGLLAEEFEIVPIVLEETLYEKVRRKLVLLPQKGNYKTRINQRYAGRRLNMAVRRAMNAGCDLFLAPVQSELIASGGIPNDCKLIYLTDATYHLMTGYYYFDSEHDRKIANYYEKMALARADAVIYPSEWPLQDALDYYGADRRKISIIRFPSYLEDHYQPKIQRNNNVINLLLVGVKWERKGVDLAIDCLKALNRRATPWRFKLRVVGLESPGMIDENISFVGRLNKNNKTEYEQLIRYYQEADIFLLPTRAECAGIVFSEANMYGLPSFTHNTGGIGAYVMDGVNGRMLELGSSGEDFADAILQMLEDT